MKIVDKTRSGYLMEVGTYELDEITGCGMRSDNRLEVGSVFKVTNSFTHLENIRSANGQRMRMIIQLRAMAEMLEIIPDAMELPEREVATISEEVAS